MSEKDNHTPPLDRAALRRLCEAATPGPWQYCGAHKEAEGCMCGLVWSIPHDHDVASSRDCDGDKPIAQVVADGNLIAAARTALPALLDALDAAEAARDDCAASLAAVDRAIGAEAFAKAHVGYEKRHELVRALRAEVERLRGRLAMVERENERLREERDALRADVAALHAYQDRLEALLSDIVGEMGGSLPAPIPPEHVREVAYDAIHKIEDERDALRAEVERLRPVVAALLADIDGGWEGPSADLLERVAEYRAAQEGAK